MNKPDTILFGTNNAHKLEEVRAILEGKIRVLSLADAGLEMDVEETELTLEGNARLKAEAFGKAAGLPCFADDTGLEVEALNGAPGVFSARYAGPGCSFADNVNKLLSELSGAENRRAQFRTVIAYFDGSTTHYFDGVVKGTITDQPTGKNGFGYDPVFWPEGTAKTFAEMRPEEKNAISHRARAVKAFVSYLLA